MSDADVLLDEQKKENTEISENQDSDKYLPTEMSNGNGESVQDHGAADDAADSGIDGENDKSEIVAGDIPKHPLQYSWVLWWCKIERGGKWEEYMKKVFTFNTVEDFWAMYHHVQAPTGLPFGTDYYLFKENIQPMWEDPHNNEGGRWLVTAERNRRDEFLDHYWLELLLAMIGEQFDPDGDFISGAVVNIRQKGDKVSLWTSDAGNKEVNLRIGHILKQKLGVTAPITYERHQDTKHKTGSLVKPLLEI